MEQTGAPAILIVDDEAGIAHTLADLLADEGYRVATAPDGPSALAAAADPALPPALVLLDVMLPGMDGRAVCRRLRAAPRRAGCRWSSSPRSRRSGWRRTWTRAPAPPSSPSPSASPSCSPRCASSWPWHHPAIPTSRAATLAGGPPRWGQVAAHRRQ